MDECKKSEHHAYGKNNHVEVLYYTVLVLTIFGYIFFILMLLGGLLAAGLLIYKKIVTGREKTEDMVVKPVIDENHDHMVRTNTMFANVTRKMSSRFEGEKHEKDSERKSFSKMTPVGLGKSKSEGSAMQDLKMLMKKKSKERASMSSQGRPSITNGIGVDL